MDLFINTIREWIEVSSTHPFIIQLSLVVLLINVLIASIIFANTFIVFNKNKLQKRRIASLKNELPLFYFEILSAESHYKVKDIQFKFDEQFHKTTKDDYELLILELADLVQINPSLKSSHNYEVLMGFLFDTNSKTPQNLPLFKANKMKLQNALLVLNNDSNKGDFKFNDKFKSIQLIFNKEDLFNAFGFDLNKNLSDWDYLLIKHYYSNYDSNELPNFASWIESTDIHSQIICFIKLIGSFKQLNSAYILEEQLNSSNDEIRKATYNTIGKLKYKNIEDKLFSNYANETEECKKEILKSIYFISSDKAIDFLKNSYHASNSDHEKKMILEVIYLYNDEGKEFFKSESSQVGYQKKNIFEYIKNPMFETAFNKEIEQHKDLKVVT